MNNVSRKTYASEHQSKEYCTTERAGNRNLKTPGEQSNFTLSVNLYMIPFCDLSLFTCSVARQYEANESIDCAAKRSEPVFKLIEFHSLAVHRDKFFEKIRGGGESISDLIANFRLLTQGFSYAELQKMLRHRLYKKKLCYLSNMNLLPDMLSVEVTFARSTYDQKIVHQRTIRIGVLRRVQSIAQSLSKQTNSNPTANSLHRNC
ncbi:hypothetical protein T11_846 [Trichinella zimbabwensis]|uniref:Uncharacterized protein n=1 Tax=Trichinella zimbabwensis TaxID=268475 RepID=A0A0V1H258_9BILA|nr:hypothetical protein T11_846 [Trichinella zimbabwensis]